MDVSEAIKTRRSIGKVKSDLPPRDLIEAILDAATYAPNHFKVNPWRFHVLTGKGRDLVGDVMAGLEQDRLGNDTTDTARKAIDGARAKAYRAPVMIAVSVDPPAHGKVVPVENIAAVAAAVQNMLLTAHALGLGAMWRTGDVAYQSRLKQALGLAPDAQIAGFVYIGYPDGEPGARERTHFAEKTVWIGDEEGAYSG